MIGALTPLVISAVTTLIGIAIVWLITMGILPDISYHIYNGHIDNLEQYGVTWNAYEIWGMCENPGTMGSVIGGKVSSIPSDRLVYKTATEAATSIHNSAQWACEFHYLSVLMRWLPALIPGMAVVVVVIKGHMAATAKGSE